MIERKTIWLASVLFTGVVAGGVYLMSAPMGETGGQAHAGAPESTASTTKAVKDDKKDDKGAKDLSAEADRDGASVQEVKYGDWVLRIETPPQSKDGKAADAVRYLFQRVVTEQGQQIASISIFPPADKDKSATAFINLPLGVFLPVGAALRVGKEGKIDKDGRQIPAVYQACLGNMGCQAASELDKDMIEDMRKGETLFVGALTLNQQQLALPFSLKSFARAYQALTKKN